MTKMAGLLGLAAVLAVVSLTPGCATAKPTESMLSEAGFKVVAATTPQQLAHLKMLPAGKLCAVNRDGKLYYVYPDVARNVLYVGQNDQYQQYKNDLWLSRHTSENQNQAEFLDGAVWSVWEGWGPLWP